MLNTILKGATSMGVGLVTKFAVEAVTPENLKKMDKILIGIGGAVIAGMASSKASEYVEAQINEVKEIFNNNKKETEEVKED